MSKSAAGEGVPFSAFISGDLELFKVGKNVQMLFIHEDKSHEDYWFKQGRESVALMERTMPACLFSVWVSLLFSS
jgi:hypothetical protein